MLASSWWTRLARRAGPTRLVVSVVDEDAGGNRRGGTEISRPIGSCRSTRPEGDGGEDGGGGREAGGDLEGLGVAGRECGPADHLVAEPGRRWQDRDRQQPPELADGVVGS